MKEKQPFMADLLIILIGNIFLGFAYAKWMVPHHIVNGGVTSLSMIVDKAFHVPLLYVSNGMTGLLLSVSLLFLGKENFVKSIGSSLFYALSFSLFYSLPFNCTINIGVDILLACLFIAFGYYCCISTNASTVGMDVIALILHKRNNKINIAKSIRFINIIILVFGFAVFGWPAIVIGLIFTYLYSWLLNILLKRNPLFTLRKSFH
ncbi:YitT family protein [Pseudobacillus sp. 179-B 2D1 NHS]|uniref:YitT family protein n=1 Tax=Pseudobacillus sp. 179-B 2D1 NHS TaxID=3374292 RepID=UPI00387A053F